MSGVSSPSLPAARIGRADSFAVRQVGLSIIYEGQGFHFRLLASFLDTLLSDSNSALTARLLEGGDLTEAFRDLPPAQQGELKSQFGAQGLEEIFALAREPDPKIFAGGLLHLGQRMSQDGKVETAVALFNWLASDRDKLLDPALIVQARQERDALLGSGSAGRRLEVLLRSTARDVTAPSLLFGMLAASTAYQGVRLLGLSRLLGSPVANLFTRGAGARLAAASLGFGAEVPSFLFASKAVQQALGQGPNWGLSGLAREGASLGLNLFLLNSFGSLAKGRLSNQAAMFSGIYLGQHLETRLGLRPAVDGATTLTDSLVFLLHFNLAGHLSRNLMGPRVQAWQRELEIRSRGEGGLGGGAWGTLGGSWERALAGGDLKLWESYPESTVEKGPVTLLSQGDGPQGTELNSRLGDRLLKKFKLGEKDERVEEILGLLKDTPFTTNPQEARKSYADLLERSQLREIKFPDGRVFAAVDQLRTAARVFNYVVEMNPLRRGVGSFYDYLMQVAFERTLSEKKLHAFDNLVRIAAIHRSIPALEGYFKDYSLNYPYQFSRALWKVALKSNEGWIKTLESLQLDRMVRNCIGNYLASFTFGEFSKGFRDPGFNFLILKAPGKPERRVPMEAEFAVQALQRMVEADSSWRPYLKDLIEQVRHSPVPMLYLDRLFKILATGNLGEKISEIAEGSPFNGVEVASILEAARPDPDFSKGGQRLMGTVYTGYLYDPILGQKFARFYASLPYLLHPDDQPRHRQEFHRKAADLLAGKENYSAEDVLELLYHRPTPLAKQARRAMQDDKVLDFEVLSAGQMEALWQANKSAKNSDPAPDGIFIPGSRRDTGRPLIAIKELDPKLSREAKIARAVYLAAFTVHEFEHYRHHQELQFTQREEMLVGEMRAWLEENFYLLTQGETGEWDKASELSPYGFGIYLRNMIDRDYVRGPRDLMVGR